MESEFVNKTMTEIFNEWHKSGNLEKHLPTKFGYVPTFICILMAKFLHHDLQKKLNANIKINQNRIILPLDDNDILSEKKFLNFEYPIERGVLEVYETYYDDDKLIIPVRPNDPDFHTLQILAIGGGVTNAYNFYEKRKNYYDIL